MRKKRLRWTILFVWLFSWASSPVLAATVTYTYDAANRLIRAEYAPGKKIEYTYDLNGNMLDRSVTAEPGIADVISILQAISSSKSAATVYKEADRTGDDRVGIQEAAHMLQEISGIRNPN